MHASKLCIDAHFDSPKNTAHHLSITGVPKGGGEKAIYRTSAPPVDARRCISGFSAAFPALDAGRRAEVGREGAEKRPRDNRRRPGATSESFPRSGGK